MKIEQYTANLPLVYILGSELNKIKASDSRLSADDMTCKVLTTLRSRFVTANLDGRVTEIIDDMARQFGMMEVDAIAVRKVQRACHYPTIRKVQLQKSTKALRAANG
jgi:hypothetical protein